MKIILMKERTSSFGTYNYGLLDRIESYIDKEPDILVGPEWLFLKPKRNIYRKSAKEKLIDKIVKMSKGKSGLIIPGTIAWYDNGYWNTAYAISNREIIHEYHKQLADSTDKDIARANQTRFREGHTSGIFNWNDLRVGIEICLDYGTLREYESERVDLHIITSCGMLIDDKSTYAKKGGHILFCDGKRLETEVRKCAAEEVYSKFSRKPYDHNHFISPYEETDEYAAYSVSI